MHPYTATSYSNIGIVYQNLGEYQKALDYHKKALNIYEQVLGKTSLEAQMTKLIIKDIKEKIKSSNK
jgi:tetratricopeptide (TPR) repeat protein